MSPTLYITGRTWALRHDLVRLGARWNRRLQAWLVSAARRPELDALAGIADIDIRVHEPSHAGDR